jgi:hypothetical protein
MFLKSRNENVTTDAVVIIPRTNLDYSSSYWATGHFGSVDAECYVQQTQQRGDFNKFPPNGSSLSLPDIPAYVFCVQQDGTVKEVSEQLFGQKFNIQGEYPLVADFNGDGIDDIFLFRQCDCADAATEAHFFASKANGTYSHTLIPVAPILDSGNTVSLTAGTQFAAMDMSGHGNGCKDVVGPKHYVFVNDCKGNFSQQKYTNPSAPYVNILAEYQWATAACAADFDGSGHEQLVLADRMVPDGNLATNAIISFDKNRIASSRYVLPTPFFAKETGIQKASHSYACRVVDIDNDGKKDLIIYTSNYYLAISPNNQPAKSYIQVYKNTSANGVLSFLDISSTAFPGYNNTGVAATYSPRWVDLNGDGFMDMVAEAPSYEGIATFGNQIFINNRDGSFSPVFVDELRNIYSTYGNKAGNATKNSMSMLPIKVNGAWDYLVMMEVANFDYSNGYMKWYSMGAANTRYVFK